MFLQLNWYQHAHKMNRIHMYIAESPFYVLISVTISKQFVAADRYLSMTIVTNFVSVCDVLDLQALILARLFSN